MLSLARRKSEALCKHNASSDNEARDNKGKQKNLISIRDEYRPLWLPRARTSKIAVRKAA